MHQGKVLVSMADYLPLGRAHLTDTKKVAQQRVKEGKTSQYFYYALDSSSILSSEQQLRINFVPIEKPEYLHKLPPVQCFIQTAESID